MLTFQDMKILQNSKISFWQAFCYRMKCREIVRVEHGATGVAVKAAVSARAVALAGGTSAAANGADLNALLYPNHLANCRFALLSCSHFNLIEVIPVRHIVSIIVPPVPLYSVHSNLKR